jgi:RimJ/RimL family protein N-acetyltransferase
MEMIWDESGLLWHYMSDRLETEMNHKNGGFMFIHKGRLVASIGVYDIKEVGETKQGSIAGAAESSRWFTRSSYEAMHGMFFDPPPHGLGLARLNSFIQVDNKHSIDITERIGFTREGLMRKAGPEGDDIVVLGMLADDPVPFKRKQDDKPAAVEDTQENED